jgi:manganese transport protein
VRWASLDTVVALGLAMFVNAAILIVAAASFHAAGHRDVVDLDRAYQLLSPLLGAPIASTLFGLALLAAGQSSTLTATLAGQVVMEGFLNLRLPPWQRRLLTRCLAIVPAAAGVLIFGEGSSTQMLILSQVILSLQLPFAVIPLVQFTGCRSLMGDLVSPPWLQGLAWAIAALLVWLNLSLIVHGPGFN